MNKSQKRLSLFIVGLCLIVTPLLVSAQSLSDRLAGQILLQVEEHGEAWYIRPEDGMRYYMKDGSVAYEMMRSFGLGITDADLALIPSVADTTEMKASSSVCGSNNLANGVKGKILLQVQQHGEAWYVHPDKCRRIYLKDGVAAYDIMRFLGLGITTADLGQIDLGLIVVKIDSNNVQETTIQESPPQNTVNDVPDINNTNQLYCSNLQNEYTNYLQGLYPVFDDIPTIQQDYVINTSSTDFDVIYNLHLSKKDSFNSKIDRMQTALNDLPTLSFDSNNQFTLKSKYRSFGDSFREAYDLKILAWKIASENQNSSSKLAESQEILTSANNTAHKAHEYLTEGNAAYSALGDTYDNSINQNNCS